MSVGPRRTSRSVRGSWLTAARIVAIAAVAALLAGCTSAARPSIAPGAVDAASGFPVGSWAKEVTLPDVGRIRFVWTFEPGGGYAEIPFALDGQTLDMVPVRGTWTADADSVTIATSWPPGMGTSTHGWRLDRDELWTVLMESDNPEDIDWFTNLDVRPWTRFTR